MRTSLFASALAFGIAAFLVSPAVAGGVAGLEVTAVGNNPFPGFESTGGTGSIAGQTAGVSATLEKDFTALGDIPFIVHANPSTGNDVIQINERVRNNTGVAWTDFHFLMEPIDANLSLAVSFENVTNSTGEWTTITPGPNSLTLLGNVPPGGIFSLSFDLRAVSQQGSFDLFGIHEVPSIPEPAFVALFAGMGLVLRRRR